MGACVEVASELAHRLLGPSSPIDDQWQEYWRRTQAVLHERPVTLVDVELASQSFDKCLLALHYDPWWLIAAMNDTPQARTRWFHLTPGRFVLALLAVEVLLWLSERFGWLGWHKGYVVLTGVAVVGRGDGRVADVVHRMRAWNT